MEARKAPCCSRRWPLPCSASPERRGADVSRPPRHAPPQNGPKPSPSRGGAEGLHGGGDALRCRGTALLGGWGVALPGVREDLHCRRGHGRGLRSLHGRGGRICTAGGAEGWPCAEGRPCLGGGCGREGRGCRRGAGSAPC